MLTLHHNFAADKHLSGRSGASLDITRTSEARYVDKAGVIQTAAAGEARFDHDPVTHESLGLLVEEARTNICLQSEDFQTTWSKVRARSNADTVNVAVAPDGTTTADQLIDDSSTGTNNARAEQTITTVVDTVYTASIFLKKDQLDWSFVEIDNESQTINAYFDLTNGAVGNSGANNVSEGIEDFGDGWYRCHITFTGGATDTTTIFRVYVAEGNGDIVVDLDGTSSILVWGAQLEAGAFPTSYIPTVAASVTRNADVVSTTDVSWLNAAAGTMYAEWIQGRDPTGAQNEFVWDLHDTGTQERIYLNYSNIDDPQFVVVDGSVVQAQLTFTNSTDENTASRSAAAWAANDFEHYLDGTRNGTGDQGGTLPTITAMNVGSYVGNLLQLNGHIKELRYYDERLANDVLEAMSEGIFPEQKFFIALTRRTAKQMRPKQRMPKPTRGLFR